MQVWEFPLCTEAAGRFPATSNEIGFAFNGITLDGDWTVEVKGEYAGRLRAEGAYDVVLGGTRILFLGLVPHLCNERLNGEFHQLHSVPQKLYTHAHTCHKERGSIHGHHHL